MDIRRWLDETAESAHFGFPLRLPESPGSRPHRCTEQLEPVLKKKQTRKRRKSDSSLLNPPSLRPKTTANKRKLSTGSESVDRARSEVSSPTRSDSTPSVSSQRYERRPRRKPRPERYEPPATEIDKRGRHAYERRKGESKKSRRMSKRKKGEKPGSGIGQKFCAKNVSGDRLTVRAAIYAVF